MAWILVVEQAVKISNVKGIPFMTEMHEKNAF